MASRPSPEFRTEAVRGAMACGLSRKPVAADVGGGFSTLSRWIQQERKTSEKPTARSDLERETTELRRENRQLREERDRPEKARVFFAEPGR